MNPLELLGRYIGQNNKIGSTKPKQNKTNTHLKMKKSIALSLATVFSLATIAFAGKAQNKDIVDVAVGAGSFETLVAAVQAAGLVDTLKGEGPFTVFAPTDEAFAALPEGTLEMLLKPENKDQLVAILTYHVVPGKVMAADVKTMKATTVNGADASLKVADSGVTIDKANVVKTDIAASNGVIHVIDAVILPPAKS
jgi:uncharacterized surface protein with fasciclin (FAS1) repeats